MKSQQISVIVPFFLLFRTDLFFWSFFLMFEFTPSEIGMKDDKPVEEFSKDKKLNMSLDEIIQNKREVMNDNKNNETESSYDESRKRYHQKDRRPKFLDLELTEREINKYLDFACVDTDGYNVELRLVLRKK